MANAHLIEKIQIKLSQVTALLKQRQQYLCTAESCTGGQLAMWLTELDGSSEWFERGFVTYSNEAKVELLGVKPDLIQNRGAVSESVAAAMAEGALENSRSDIAVSITGIAGPFGGSPDKPVGTVCFAVAKQHNVVTETKHFASQDRQINRAQSCLHALTMVEKFTT